MEPFLPYAKQSISQEDSQALSQGLQGDWITRGPSVEAFEAAIAKKVGAPYAVVFNSGTSALSAAYFAGSLTSGDRIITTPNTFFGTIAAPVAAGAEIDFVDIDIETGSFDINKLDEKINGKFSRGKEIIVPVHFAGPAVDMRTLNLKIQRPDTFVIEDAAHALGSYYKTGERVGSCAYSDITIFSLHPAKIMTTGEGGIAVTASKDLFDKLQRYRNNGIARYPNQPLWHYSVLEATGNYNFTDFQAELGLSQLKRIDRFIETRRMLMAHYRKKLEKIEWAKMLSQELASKTAYHLAVILIDFETLGTTRELAQDYFKSKGIGTQLHYIPIYRHPVLKKHADIKDQYPVMERYFEQALSFPLYSDLTESDIDRVIQALEQLPKIGQKKTKESHITQRQKVHQGRHYRNKPRPSH